MNAENLLSACEDGNIKKVMRCADVGVNLETRADRQKWTPILIASWFGHRDIVEYLAGRGVDLEARDNDGETPIMFASRQGYKGIVKFLVEKGVDLGAKDNNGNTALSIALNYNHASVAGYLASHIIPNPDIPYSGIPVSYFVPQNRLMPNSDYTGLIKSIIPIYVNRAITDSAFGIAMQQDVEEILGGKKEDHKRSLVNEDITLLTKLLKTLRSIDYTDQIKQESNKETSPAYDMEL